MEEIDLHLHFLLLFISYRVILISDFFLQGTREKFVLLVLFNKNIYREKIPLQMKFQRRIALYTPPEGAMKFNENWREL